MTGSGGNPQDLREAARNAVAIAAHAYQQEQFRFRSILILAERHGLSMEDLVDASGLDEAEVVRLIDGWV